MRTTCSAFFGGRDRHIDQRTGRLQSHRVLRRAARILFMRVGIPRSEPGRGHRFRALDVREAVRVRGEARRRSGAACPDLRGRPLGEVYARRHGAGSTVGAEHNGRGDAVNLTLRIELPVELARARGRPRLGTLAMTDRRSTQLADMRRAGEGNLPTARESLQVMCRLQKRSSAQGSGMPMPARFICGRVLVSPWSRRAQPLCGDTASSTDCSETSTG